MAGDLRNPEGRRRFADEFRRSADNETLAVAQTQPEVDRQVPDDRRCVQVLIQTPILYFTTEELHVHYLTSSFIAVGAVCRIRLPRQQVLGVRQMQGEIGSSSLRRTLYDWNSCTVPVGQG